MSEVKHTPGPWKVYLTADGREIVGIGEQKNGDGIADCGFGLWRFGSEEAKANAHLIAAAPDLLAALRDMTPTMPSSDAPCHLGIVPQSGCAHCNRIARARAALARAEGRTP